MKIGTSPLTGNIYIGSTRKDKQGRELWTKKEDVTEQAIKAVFEQMYDKAKNTGYYEYLIKGYGKLCFEREQATEEEQNNVK